MAACQVKLNKMRDIIKNVEISNVSCFGTKAYENLIRDYNILITGIDRLAFCEANYLRGM
jgi:ethanolamine utilization cobalamin adenosyltransferase